MNLIEGFEDVITHIRQLEFRLTELEAHKKQSAFQINKLKKDNDELKEENEACEEAIKILKDENEVNKKNRVHWMEEKKKEKDFWMNYANGHIATKLGLCDQVDQLGILCKNIDQNAYDSWKKITNYEEEESESEEENDDEECICCDKVMTMKCEYENCETSSVIHSAYKWYIGSEFDDGPVCQDCVVTIYEEEESS